MELGGRPLLDTGPDASLFIARTELEPLLDAAARGLNALVLGERGAGKTSLLRHLTYRLREDGQEAVFIDVGLADSALEVIDLVRAAVGQSPSVPNEALVGITGMWSRHAPRRLGTEASQLLAAIRPLRDAPPATLLIDSLPSSKTAHVLFGRLRDELWQLPYTWVVAGDARDERVLLSPPADAFFDVKVGLAPLDREQATELLRRRLAGDARRLPYATLAEASKGNPRRLLELARQAAVEGRTASDLNAERLWFEKKLSELNRPAAMLAAELAALGEPVSASDPELLKRLGWSRPRATQVLRELEEAGMLHSFSEGRRKLYALATPRQLDDR